MAQRPFDKPLTDEEIVRVEQRIKEVRVELGLSVNFNGKKSPVTIELLAKAHAWIHSRFNYRSDISTFDTSDYWNPLAFDWLMLDDYLDDDCDGEGYALIAFYIRVLNLDEDYVRRVSCSTEDKEGHFVVWTRCLDDVWYQTENRLYTPRTVAFMHDKGYRYWLYSPMTEEYISQNVWLNAEDEAMRIIYNTPNNVMSDNNDDVTFLESVKKVTASKTLGTAGGTMIAGGSAVATALANQVDWKIVALLGGYVLIGFIFWVLRMKTNKSVRNR